MKALVLKDIYVLWKQMRIFLLIVLVLSAIPSTFNNVFAVIYAAMLPYTAVAYDERSHWDQLAAMMPYTNRAIVLSKYVLGWLCILTAAVLSLLLQGILSLVLADYFFSPSMVFLAVWGAAAILAVTLPLMFRFGVERGRMVMFLIIFLVCAGAGALSSVAISASKAQGFVLSGPLMAALPLMAVVLTLISVPLSVRLYQQKDR